MSKTPADDPILKRFRATLDKIYGERLERVVLFGSRAWGDAREDSDYDVAVFLEDFVDRWQEVDRIIPVVTEILDEHEAFIHAIPGGRLSGSHVADGRDPPREGVDL